MSDETRPAQPFAPTLSAQSNWTAGAPTTTADQLKSGDTIGRYVIRDHLGSGGMGTVYRAQDPRLDRDVALKLLRGQSNTNAVATKRLHREAQALAKLSHPNIVAVYDLDTHDGQVFIAMELVEGETLGEWLRNPKRSLDDIVTTFIEAGNGLAAAHAEGLVHRDFKPSNVIVGNDGRVRVLDFGLAGLLDEGIAPSVSPTDAPLHELTRQGAIMGTPAYMAPEQHLGKAAVPASDQFALCVSLYEAVFGQHPFGGDSTAELASRVAAGTLRTPPTDNTVPTWLETALLKGMATEPSRRYESMADLVRELSRDRNSRRRNIKLIAAGGGAVAIASVIAFSLGGTTDKPTTQAIDGCSGVAKKLDEAWSPAVRAAVSKRAPARVRGALIAKIDAYAVSWRDHRTAICKHRDEAYAHRVQCLESARVALKSVTTLLSSAAPSVFDNVAVIVASLPALEECNRPAGAVSWQIAPANAAAAAERIRVVDDASRVLVLRYGKPKQAAALVNKLANELGAMRDPMARAHAARALSHFEKNPKKAEALLRRAIADAIAVRDETKVVLTYTDLIGHLIGQRRFADVIREADLADAHNQRMRQFVKTWPRTAMWYALFGGRIAVLRGLNEAARGKHLDAIPHYRKAVELWQKTAQSYPAHLGEALNNLADALRTTGHYADAVKMLDRAVALAKQESSLNLQSYLTMLSNRAGANLTAGWITAATKDFTAALELAGSRPIAATLAFNLAGLHVMAEHLDKAQQSLEMARKIWLPLVGPKHHLMHVATLLECTIRRERGQHKQAAALCRTAIDNLSKLIGAKHPYVASAKIELGLVMLDQHQYKNARDLVTAAIAIYKKTTGLSTMEVGVARATLGRALFLMGRRHHRAAETVLRDAVKTFDQLKLSRHPAVVPPLVDHAELLSQHGDAQAARTLIDRALAVATVPNAVVSSEALKRAKALDKKLTNNAPR